MSGKKRVGESGWKPRGVSIGKEDERIVL